MALDICEANLSLVRALSQRQGATELRISRQALDINFLCDVANSPTLKTLSLHRVLVKGDGSTMRIAAETLKKVDAEGCYFAQGAFQAFTRIVEANRLLEEVKLVDFRGLYSELYTFLCVLVHISTLHSLDLDGCNLYEIPWKGSISRAYWTGLSELLLPRNQLNEAGLRAMFSVLPAGVQLKTLDLSSNCLGDGGVTWLSDWICGMGTTLQRVSLNDNLIGPLGASALSRAIALQRDIHVLYVASNPLTDSGALSLLEALTASSVEIIDLSSTQTSLSTLDVATKIAKTLFASETHCAASATLHRPFSGLSRLHKLFLAGSYLGDYGVSLLAEAKQSLERLKQLNLSFCGLTQVGGQSLGLLLSYAVNTCNLVLTGNSLGSEGVTALCFSLGALKRLKHLDLKANSIGLQGAQSLASVLSNFPRLSVLKLSENRIENQGVLDLCDAFTTTPVLSNLHLADVGFDSQICEELGQALAGLRKLKYLHLGKNRISDSGMGQLLTVISSIKSLKAISISYTLISDDLVPDLFECLSKLPFLTQLNCDGNKLGACFLEELQSCPFLTNVSARKNEFAAGREPICWDLILDMNFAYSKISAYRSESKWGFSEVLKLSGCNLMTSNWNELFESCGRFLRLLMLDDDHLKADGLARLFEHSPFLTSLSLSNALLDNLDCKWGFLCASLQSLTLTHINTLSGSQHLRPILSALPRLKHLAFTHNSLSPRDQVEVLQILGCLTMMEELEIGNVRDRGNFKLADALLRMTRLTSLKITGLPGADRRLAYYLRNLKRLNSLAIRNFSNSGFTRELTHTLPLLHLSALDLSGCLLSAQDIETLFPGLISLKGLKRLAFCNCKLDESVLSVVFSAVELGEISLEEADFSGNDLSFTDAKPFCSFLNSQKSLKELRLNGLVLTDSQITEVGTALEASNARVLSLDGATLSDWPRFMTLVGKMESLSSLSLSNNIITDAIFTGMFPSLLSTPQLQTLTLNFNRLTFSVLPLLCSLCLRKQASISLISNAITTPDLDQAVDQLQDEEDGWFVDERLTIR